jgi:hypothetical protein
MATNGSLNDAEEFRAVITYQSRKPNPEHTWENRSTVPAYLDEWTDETTKVRGPYQTATNARTQAGRDAAELARDWCWQISGVERISRHRILTVGIERTSLAWEPFDVRDPDTAKWGA